MTKVQTTAAGYEWVCTCVCTHIYIYIYTYAYIRLKNPLVNGFGKRYHLRRENGSAEARRKRGGGSAEANPIRRKRAEARGSVAEGSPKQVVQTLTGVPT